MNHSLSLYPLIQRLFTADSTVLSYWLNWRVLLCVIWVFTSMVIALCIIWKFELFDHWKSDERDTQKDAASCSYCPNVWRPCLKEIHPAWLLLYRVIVFSLLLASLIDRFLVNGGRMFYYYTQWTFTSVTIYFGLGSLLSVYGCYKHHQTNCRGYNVHRVETDAEQGCYTTLTYGESKSSLKMREVSNPHSETYVFQTAGSTCCLFQVLFQMNAGAVMLTDVIYWSIIFPFLTIKDYSLNFMTVNMHTLNLVVLLGDAALNCLKLPWFGIAYFVLWTGVFVIFQWIIHACIPIWWPYPFLDLSSHYAPLWYFLMGLMHIPCYGIFLLFLKTKHHLLSKWFPQSYQCL